MTAVPTASFGPGDSVARWQQQLANVAGDITALDDDELYKDLERGSVGNPPALSGETLRQAVPLVRTVHVLFQQYSRLNDRITAAASARASVSSWIPGHPAMRQVEQMLTDPIELAPDEIVPGQAARVSPASLLAALSSAIPAVQHDLEPFRLARDSALATLTAARVVVAELERDSNTLGIGAPPELATIRARIEQLGAGASSDPLATYASFRKDILPVLEDAQRLVKAFQAARADLDARLAAAQGALQRLATAHDRAVHGWQNAAQKVRLDPGTLRPPATTDAQVVDLTQWLGRLVAMAATAAWRGADGPLAAWSRIALPLLEAESAVALINSGPLDQLELLRGRLTVLRAVAESNGLGLMSASSSTEGKAALVAYRAAEQALLRETADIRIDLAQAGVLVDRYALLVDPGSLPDGASDRARRR